MSQPLIQSVGHQINVHLQLLDNASCAFQCLIILNTNIKQEMMELFINSTKTIIVADGGANQLYKSKFRDAGNVKVIIGDLDSIEKEVSEYYRDRGVKVVYDEDQNTNDFQKALSFAINSGIKDIVCFGIMGGRADQQFANLSLIEQYSKVNPNLNLLAFGAESLLYLVKSQIKTKISVGKRCILNQVGLICFGKSKLQTQGFKWNLGQSHGLPYLQWGSLVSSSNKIQSQSVSILSSKPIFFTVQLKQKN